MNSGWPRYHQTRALYTTGVHILDCFSCGELWPVITTCHQEASSAPEQLSIPSQRDEEFKRCPQQILGTVVAVNRITGFNIRSTPPLCIYIYMNHPMIFPLNMIFPYIPTIFKLSL